MSDPVPASTPAPPPRRRSLVRWLLNVVTGALIALLLLGVIGFLLRDRWRWSQLLMFVPLSAVGVIVAGWDLVRLGRAIKPRFGLTIVALFAAGLSVLSMIGLASPAVGKSGAPSLRVVHWNVLWGAGAENWPVIARQIRDLQPDIVVLSEAANYWQIKNDLCKEGEGHFVEWDYHWPDPYTFRLVVASRWPVKVVCDGPVPTTQVSHDRSVMYGEMRVIPTGVAMLVRVDCPWGPMHVLVVDGGSDPFEPRRPRTEAVAALVREYARRGIAVDLIAGDFNTPGRSVGFDWFRDEQWTFAEDVSLAWRGTFPRKSPFWDIDHVIASTKWGVTRDQFLYNGYCDHWGQVVDLSREK